MIAKVHRGAGCSCHYMLNTNIVHFGKRIKDRNDAKVFDECVYTPPVRVKYLEVIKT